MGEAAVVLGEQKDELGASMEQGSSLGAPAGRAAVLGVQPQRAKGEQPLC